MNKVNDNMELEELNAINELIENDIKGFGGGELNMKIKDPTKICGGIKAAKDAFLGAAYGHQGKSDLKMSKGISNLAEESGKLQIQTKGEYVNKTSRKPKNTLKMTANGKNEVFGENRREFFDKKANLLFLT